MVSHEFCRYLLKARNKATNQHQSVWIVNVRGSPDIKIHLLGATNVWRGFSFRPADQLTAISREKLLARLKTDNRKAILSFGENPPGQKKKRTNVSIYLVGKLIQSCSKYKRLVYLLAQRQSQPRRAFIPYFPSSVVKHKTHRRTNGDVRATVPLPSTSADP